MVRSRSRGSCHSTLSEIAASLHLFNIHIINNTICFCYVPVIRGVFFRVAPPIYSADVPCGHGRETGTVDDNEVAATIWNRRGPEQKESLEARIVHPLATEQALRGQAAGWPPLGRPPCPRGADNALRPPPCGASYIYIYNYI